MTRQIFARIAAATSALFFTFVMLAGVDVMATSKHHDARLAQVIAAHTA